MGKKDKPMNYRRKPTSRPGRCRDCGRAARVPVNDWYRAGSPRCLACGGVMDKTYGRAAA